MTDILTRLRDATPNDECSILRDVINFACEKSWISNVERVQALRLVAVGAFIDAALTLRAEDEACSILIYPGGRAGAGIGHPPMITDVEFATAALAICHVIFEARMAKEDAA